MVYMRIKFLNDCDRDDFFSFVKNKIGKNWKEISRDFSINKSSLDRYRNGKILIPQDLFFNFLDLFTLRMKKLFLSKIKKLPNNLGQIKGGKIAYLKNLKSFEEGREKGISSILQSQDSRGSLTSVSFNRILSSEICEFIGAFIGDGFFNVYNNKLYQIEFAGDSRYDLNYYQKTIIPIVKKIVPNVKPHILKVKNKNSIRVIFYSKNLFFYLKEFIGFAPGKKAYTISIPEKIVCNPHLMISAVRGIFDTDGGIFFDKRKGYKKSYPRIFFNTVSKNLFDQVSNFLSKHFKVYTYFNKKRNLYGLEIYGHKNLKKWMSLVGFSNERHLKKLLL